MCLQTLHCVISAGDESSAGLPAGNVAYEAALKGFTALNPDPKPLNPKPVNPKSLIP